MITALRLAKPSCLPFVRALGLAGGLNDEIGLQCLATNKRGVDISAPSFLVGRSWIAPYFLSVTIENADALTPGELEAGFPRLMEAIKNRHADLLSLVEKEKPEDGGQ